MTRAFSLHGFFPNAQPDGLGYYEAGPSALPSHRKTAGNPKSSVRFLHIANSDKPVVRHNLDVITTVACRALPGKNGKPRIDNNTLAAMTLMVALSHPREKEIMCLPVMNFLKNGNG